MAASMVIGDQDINGIALSEVPIVPVGVRSASPPGPGGTHAPGIPIALASLHGKIVEQGSQSPITDGTVFLVGDHWVACPIDTDGKFELHQLIPGNYSIEMQLVGYPTIRRSITIDETDLNMELTAPE